MRACVRYVAIGIFIAIMLSPADVIGQAVQGIQLFEQHCAQCHHSPAPDSRAPDRNSLRQLSTESILATMTSGTMASLASALSDEEKRVLAEQLTGRPLGTRQSGHASAMSHRCSQTPAASLDGESAWSGWGNGMGNTRFQPAGGARLTADDLPRLTLQWAFGFPGGMSAFGQPTIAGGRVFVGTDIGYVYALDLKSGCVFWSFQAQASVRTAIVVGSARIAGRSRDVLFFGDVNGHVYAIDSVTSALIWSVRPETHPFARITGTPAYANGRLYVPLSSFEEVAASNPRYECCTSRGGVVAYDAATGNEVWRSYVTPEPERQKKNAAGTQMWGPSGAAIWSAPTIDERRRAIYVATGNGYSDPAPANSDAVVALDLDSGKQLWAKQLMPRDTWIVGCSQGRQGHANCPVQPGPDFDFGSSPILRTLKGGRDVLAAGQKSGVAWALDPDKRGAVLWERRVGRGSAAGGIVWGPAADEEKGYFAVGDAVHGPTIAGGLSALALATGEVIWSVRPPEMKCGDFPCVQAQAAAVSAIPGVVFSGTTSGIMRAYSTADGTILWEYNSVRAYQPVNGVLAKGGAFNGPGPAIAAGMIVFNSGYAYVSGGLPGNVLLAFGVE